MVSVILCGLTLRATLTVQSKCLGSSNKSLLDHRWATCPTITSVSALTPPSRPVFQQEPEAPPIQLTDSSHIVIDSAHVTLNLEKDASGVKVCSRHLLRSDDVHYITLRRLYQQKQDIWTLIMFKLTVASFGVEWNHFELIFVVWLIKTYKISCSFSSKNRIYLIYKLNNKYF